MNRFKKTLAGFGLALGLLALPIGAGAVERPSNHRLFRYETVQSARHDPVACYGMLDFCDLEQITGRKNLDRQAIQFLEWNVWDYAVYAQPAGGRDELLTRSDYRFLEENIWGSSSLPPYGDVEETY